MNDNISQIMRSLFRLFQLKTCTVPLIVDTELDNFKKKFTKLTKNEIYYLFENWEEYHTKQDKKQIIADTQCEKLFDTFIQKLH